MTAFGIALLCLAIFGILSEPPRPYQPTRRQLRQWRKERLRLR